MIGKALLPELWTEILVPVCAVVGIAFSLFQWYIVSCVKLTADGGASSSSSSVTEEDGKNVNGDYLIEEEEGVNDQSVVAKCAEIQTAISEGDRQLLFDFAFAFFFLKRFSLFFF